MIGPHRLLKHYPFSRLAALLEATPPGNPDIAVPGRDPTAPVLLSVGEPQTPPPAMIAEELSRDADTWSRYPPLKPTPDYLDAAIGWLHRRYDLPPGMIDPKTMLCAVPGSREGLFFAALTAVPPPDGGGPQPAMLMPSPCYHVYPGAAAAAGAEAVFVPATAETGHLPDFAALEPSVLERTAFAFYCSPANPQGAAATLDELAALIRLAREHDFIVAFDECYAEIYTGAPPPGALQAAAALGGSLDNVLVFHSLSKRSSAPGLRCGFAVGDPRGIAAIEGALRVGGAGVPFAVQAAGARLWNDEVHVREIRALYRENFAIAERVLGNRFGFRTPDGGFFLWLDVGDGEAAARELWRAAGIRVLPGAYMCADAPDGGNPGTAYIRVALVYDPRLTEAALQRLVEVL